MSQTPPVPGAVKISSRDMAERHHSTRTKARKAALDVLYQAEQRQEDLLGVLASESIRVPERIRPFTKEIINGIAENLDAIHARIDECVSGDWTLERMPAIDRCLARIAIWEIDYTATSTSVVISEAVELADEFSTDNSVKFLNGLLAKAVRTKQ